MQSISERSFSSKWFNVFQILFIVGRKRHFEADIFTVNEGEQFFLFEDSWVHDVFEIAFSKSSIPVIDYVSSVHYLTENVDQIFKWYFWWSACSLHISVQNQITVSQVTHVEGIRHIPSKWSKTFTLDDSRVEEAQTKQNTFYFLIFLIDLFFREISESSFHICFYTWRRLVCQFDGSVQYTNGHTSWRLSRQQKTEVNVWSSSITWERVQNLLQLEQPSRHEVNIL